MLFFSLELKSWACCWLWCNIATEKADVLEILGNILERTQCDVAGLPLYPSAHNSAPTLSMSKAITTSWQHAWKYWAFRGMGRSFGCGLQQKLGCGMHTLHFLSLAQPGQNVAAL